MSGAAPSGEGHAFPAPTVSLVQIVDHGTGLGHHLVSTLGLDERELLALTGSEDHTPGSGPVLSGAAVVMHLVLTPVPDGAPVPLVSVAIDDDPAPPLWPEAEVADRVLSLLTQRFLDQHPERAHLHGGAVADGRGRGVVVLGPSGSGKSTLIAHLVASGFGLVSDEQLAIDPAIGAVTGFTRPIGIKPGSIPHLPDRVAADLRSGSGSMLLGCAALGGHHVTSAQPALVVFPGRDADAADVSFEIITPAQALQGCCENNLDLLRDPQLALASFARLSASTPAIRLRYRDASTAVPLLAELVSSPPAHRRTEWSWDHRVDEPDGIVHRSPTVLSLTIADELVLVDRRTRRVSSLDAEERGHWASLPWAAIDIGPDADAASAMTVLRLHDEGFVEGSPVGTVYRRARHLVGRTSRHDVLVMDGAGQTLRLTGLSARIWRALERPSTPYALSILLADRTAGPGDLGRAGSPPSDSLHLVRNIAETIHRLVQIGIVDPVTKRAFDAPERAAAPVYPDSPGGAGTDAAGR